MDRSLSCYSTASKAQQQDKIDSSSLATTSLSKQIDIPVGRRLKVPQRHLENGREKDSMVHQAGRSYDRVGMLIEISQC